MKTNHEISDGKGDDSAAWLAAIVESSDDAIIGKSLDTTITSWNRGAERLYGYSAAEAIGRSIEMLVPPDRPDELPAIMERLRRGEHIEHYETERIAKDGRRLLVSVSISPIRNEAGRVVGASAIARDVTQRAELDKALRQQARLLDLSYDAIFVRDLTSRISYWSEGAVRLYGWSAEEAKGNVAHALLKTEFPQLRLPIDALVAEEGHWEGELTHTRRDGTRIVVDSRHVLVHDARGRPSGFLETNRDITDRKTAEQALRASRDELQAILQTVADGVIEQDPSGRIVYANAAAARLSGYPSAEALLAVPLPDILARFQLTAETGEPLTRDQLPAQRAFRGDPAPTAILHGRTLTTGEESWSAVRARPIRDPDGKVRLVVSAFQDVTPIKLAEIREHFLNQASALLAESLDYDTTLQRVAQLAIPQLADWAIVDIVQSDGAIRRVALAHTDPAKIAWAQDLKRHFPTDPDAATGVPNVIRSGEPEFYPQIPQDLLKAAAADEEARRILEELHLTSAMTVPLRARGTTLGAMSFIYAESDRHYTEADLRCAQELADRAALAVDNARLHRDALAALHVRDEFLAAISHDLRTPLTIIRGLAQLMGRRLEPDKTAASEAVTGALAEVDQAAEKMARMIDSLLDLSRLESGRPLDLDKQRVELVALARHLSDEHQRGAPSHQIRFNAANDRLEGIWDALRLERVLANLLSNAIKYSPEGGSVVVTVAVEREEERDASWATVSVQDDGIGIPAAELEAIFERFHRGSNVMGSIRGIGIGLAGAKQIVEQHNGTLTVESEEGKGSRFIVRLPIEEEPEAG